MKRARNRSVSTPHNAGESFSFSRIRGHRFILSDAKGGRILLHSAAPFNRPLNRRPPFVPLAEDPHLRPTSAPLRPGKEAWHPQTPRKARQRTTFGAARRLCAGCRLCFVRRTAIRVT